MIKETVSIRFDDKEETTELILLDKKTLTIESKSWFWKFFSFIFGRKKQSRPYKIWVELFDLPESLQVTDPSKLILLQSSDISSPLHELQNIIIRKTGYQYRIFLDPNQIIDCTQQANFEEKIRFTIHHQRPKARKSDFSVELEFSLLLEKASPHANTSLIIQSPEIVYSKARIQVGRLEIENTAIAEYSYPFECTVDVRLYNSQTNAPCEEVAAFNNPDTGDSFSARCQLSALKAHQTRTLPIFLDLNAIENPYKKAEYTISVDFVYVSENQETRKNIKPEKITILQDVTTDALKAIIREGARHHCCDSARKRTYQLALKHWNGPDASGQMTCFTFELGNYAESSSGAVYIENLTIIPEVTPDSMSPIEVKIPSIPESSEDEDDDIILGPVSRKTSVLEENKLAGIFSINGKPLTELKRSYCFGGDNTRTTSLVCSFRHDAIADIPDDVATIRFTIQFDYVESSELLSAEALSQKFLDQQEYQRFSFAAELVIERYLGAYWLALDFGTSAIVAQFDEDTDKMNLLNLQTSLQDFTQADKYTKDEIPEYDTPFLASTMLLRPNGIVDTENSKEGILRIAPDRTTLGTNLQYLIPYLKSLIGTEKLPNVNRNLDDYFYKQSPDDSDVIKFTKKPIEVNTVLSVAYRLLLGEFIGRCLEKQNQTDLLNKIIISVPNMFTPRHAEHIRSSILNDTIIKKTFHIRKDYLTFISESDAVACYYISQWPFMNELRPDKAHYQPGTEYVLIYDMGAGTVDLTYLKIETDEEGNRKVSIIGRLGKNTAGNYLDFSIAQYLNKIYGKDFSNPVFGPSSGIGTVGFRHGLKDVIKEQIKPCLDQEGTVELSKDFFSDKEENELLDIQALKQSHFIRDFIESNTDDIFKNFFALYKDFDGVTHVKGQFPIDTVMISGRSTQLQFLKDEIRGRLAAWTIKPQTEIFYPKIKDANTLKSAVVQGALQYALLYHGRENARVKITSRNLQARYGVLYKNPSSGLWKFLELLNPSTKALNEESPDTKEGITIYQYDTDIFSADGAPHIIDLSATPVGYFVQSYAENTERDINEGNAEYITKMYSFKNNQFSDPGHVSARISITEENQMIFSIGDLQDDPKHPMKFALDESETFRNSMWPYWE